MTGAIDRLRENIDACWYGECSMTAAEASRAALADLDALVQAVEMALPRMRHRQYRGSKYPHRMTEPLVCYPDCEKCALESAVARVNGEQT